MCTYIVKETKITVGHIRIFNTYLSSFFVFRFGRKKILIINTFITGVIGISKSMVTSYWLYIALEMLEPMIGDNYSTAYTMGKYFSKHVQGFR